MNRPRLQHAIALMERVRDQGLPFNMGLWFADKGNPEDCGTAACFGGWCARDPEFRAAGMGIDVDALSYHNRWGSGAIAEFFGLSLRDTRFLTMPKAYGSYDGSPESITPDHVIARIRALLDSAP